MLDRLLVHLASVHDPAGLRGAGADPGHLHRGLARPRRDGLATFRRVVLPLALPGVVAGSIFTFSLTLGDYITPLLVGGGKHAVHRQRRLRRARRQRATCRSRPRSRRIPRRRDGASTSSSRAGSERSRRSDGERAATRVALGIWTVLVVLFLWIPLVIILVYAFNTSNIQSWPIPGWTTALVPRGVARPGVRASLWLSLKAACSRRGSRSCSARWRRSPSAASGSSAARRSRSCFSCRSRCPGSSPGWR